MKKIIIVLLFFISCNSDNSGSKFNVILISIDTLRMDRMLILENYKELITDSVFFSNAYTHSSWTLPSHISVFTSHYPGKYFRSFSKVSKRFYPRDFFIPPDSLILPEVLNDLGYEVVSFNEGGFVSGDFGFSQGYDNYQSVERSFSFANSIGFIESNNDFPFFMFLHTYDIHAPYKYENIYCGIRPKRIKSLNLNTFQLDGKYYGWSSYDCGIENYLESWAPDKEEKEYLINIYDGGVKITDLYLDLFIKKLKSKNLYDNSLIILFSDHGEELWDNVPELSMCHGHCLYDYIVKVPLIIKMPCSRYNGLIIDKPVRLIDIYPTILDVVGHANNCANIEGVSLIPLITGYEKIDRICYGGWNCAWITQYYLRKGNYKLIYTPYPEFTYNNVKRKYERYELYNLKIDPQEKVNLYKDGEEISNKMIEILNSEKLKDIPMYIVDDSSEESNFTKENFKYFDFPAHVIKYIKDDKIDDKIIDDKIIEELKSLGYF